MVVQHNSQVYDDICGRPLTKTALALPIDSARPATGVPLGGGSGEPQDRRGPTGIDFAVPLGRKVNVLVSRRACR